LVSSFDADRVKKGKFRYTGAAEEPGDLEDFRLL
jgi:hypothetical protein